MSIRTDLAVEMIDEDAKSLPKGIKRKLRKSSACAVTEIIVADDAAGMRIGKSRGRYVTVETDRLSASPQDFDEQVANIAAEIIALKGSGRKTALVAGLGNSDITPDALGPLVVSHNCDAAFAGRSSGRSRAEAAQQRFGYSSRGAGTDGYRSCGNNKINMRRG